MDREISTLHQRISRLVSDAEKFVQDDQGTINLDQLIETKWRRFASQIDISVKGAGGQLARA